MAADTIKKSVYKRWDGSKWEVIYFKTSYDQVGVDGTTRFLKPSTHTVNGKPFAVTTVTNGVSTTTDQAITLDLEANGIVTLKAGITQSNGAIANDSNSNITLAKVAKTGLFSDLGSKPTTLSGYGITDAVPSSLKVNNVGIDSNNKITLYGTDIKMASNVNTTLKAAIDNVVAVAEGKTKTYVAAVSSNSSLFTSSNLATDHFTFSYVKNVTKLTAIDGDTYLSNLKVGDIIYLTDTEEPDWWVGENKVEVQSAGGGTTTEITLYRMETTKPNFSPYAKKSETVNDVTYDSTSHKIQKTIGLTVSDVFDLDNFAGIDDSNGAITIGGITKTPLYSHQTMYYRPISVAGTSKLSSTSSSALNFSNTGNVKFTYDNDLTANVICVTSARVSGNTLTLTPSVGDEITFKGTQIFYGSSVAQNGQPAFTPSGYHTGDIWIDTYNTIATS